MGAAAITSDAAILEKVLSGKEERVIQRDSSLLSGFFACQITLNIPGYPKHLSNEISAINEFRRRFTKKYRLPLRSEKIIDNPAGHCWIGYFCGTHREAAEAKKIAVEIEESSPEGRALDIDIVTPEGSLSRHDLGLPPRKCVLCESPAKECAAGRKHPYDELRAEIIRLIKKL